MLHFNPRDWFRMFPDDSAAEAVSVPIPSTAKEYYLAKIAGHTPTKKQTLFSGYGEFSVVRPSNICQVAVSIQNADANMTVMLGDRECSYVESFSDWQNTEYSFMITDSNSNISIHVFSEADAANKVVIFKNVELTPPQPKTVTEFYLAKMAGVEVVDHIEKVFEQEFTFGTEPDGKGNYDVGMSNAYDTEGFDSSHFITHIDGNDNNPSFYVSLSGDGTVLIRTENASYAGTIHTLELFYKTAIEDVPVKTRTEQYLKAIAANQDSSDSSKAGLVPKG